MRRFSRGRAFLLVGNELGNFPRLERERLARKPMDDPSTKPSAATTRKAPEQVDQQFSVGGDVVNHGRNLRPRARTRARM
jgi:hypothetical protein